MSIDGLVGELKELMDDFADRQKDIGEQIFQPESEYLEDKIIQVERIVNALIRQGITVQAEDVLGVNN